MTVGSLFSGIGGLERGLERAGMSVRWQVERDSFCRLVLESHWPGVARHDDVTAIRDGDLESVDLICGGFPCQPVSIAGQRKGAEDERWLWPEMLRIIRMVAPRYVLVENVPGLLTHDGGRTFGCILGDLAESGLDAEWDCVPASALGAPHQRDRVFLVAYAKGGRERRLHLRSGQQEATAPVLDGLGEAIRRTRDEWSEWWATDPAEVADADGAEREEPTESEPGKAQQSTAHAACREWQAQPHVGRVADGVPARVAQIRSLGNAVVPQVAEAIGRCIMTHHRKDTL